MLPVGWFKFSLISSVQKHTDYTWNQIHKILYELQGMKGKHDNHMYYRHTKSNFGGVAFHNIDME